MATIEPLSDENLADIEATLQAIGNDWRASKLDCTRDGENITRQYMSHVHALLSEVYRQRAALAECERISEKQNFYLNYLSVENARLRAQLAGTVDKDEGDTYDG